MHVAIGSISKKNTTSFLVSEQLNKHLERYEFESPESGLALYIKSAKDTIPISIGEFNALVRPLFDDLVSINDSLVFQRAVVSRSEVVLDSLTDLASRVMSESITDYKQVKLAVYQHRIDSLKQQELEQLQSGKDSTDLVRDGLYVKMAQAQVEFAQNSAKIQSSILDNYASFMPVYLSDEIRMVNNHYIESLISLQRLELSRLTVARRIKGLSSAFHKNRRDSMNFWNFLYYSICVSTSMSFGDIAPNDMCTRIMAIIELVSCVILIGVIINHLDPYRKKNDSEVK